MKHKILIFILIITQLYSADKKDLSIKQHGVVNQLDELENKMIRLIDSLKNTEPELAQRLTNALKALKDKRLSPRFAEIATHLKENDLDSAIKDQTQATRDLLQMLEILQEENEYDKLRKEIERLKNLSKTTLNLEK